MRETAQRAWRADKNSFWEFANKTPSSLRITPIREGLETTWGDGLGKEEKE